MSNRATVEGYFPAVLGPYAEHHDGVIRFVEAGDTVPAEIRFDGRLRDGRPVGFDTRAVARMVRAA